MWNSSWCGWGLHLWGDTKESRFAVCTLLEGQDSNSNLNSKTSIPKDIILNFNKSPSDETVNLNPTLYRVYTHAQRSHMHLNFFDFFLNAMFLHCIIMNSKNIFDLIWKSCSPCRRSVDNRTTQIAQHAQKGSVFIMLALYIIREEEEGICWALSEIQGDLRLN